MNKQDGDLPVSGPGPRFRVLDLTQAVAGPYATRLLAGFGADVLKIERPGMGDVSRRTGPFPNDRPDTESSGLFFYLNGGKRSMTLDLASPSGRKILHELAPGFDLIITSFRPSTADRLGLNPDEWLDWYPGIVFLSITNFGRTGPYRDFRAADLTLEALGGLLYITGEPNHPPLRDPGNQAQYIAGLNAYSYALAALWERRTSGLGQAIDLAIAASVTHMLENTMMRWEYAGQIRRRGGVFRSSIYPARDGYIGVFDGAGRFFRQVAELVEEPKLLDPKYAAGFQATDVADEVDALLLPWLIEHDKEDIFRRAQQRRLPFGPVRSTKDVVESDQLRSRGWFDAIDHPIAGKVTIPSAPFRLPALPWQPSRAPLLGEHTAEVLSDLGYSERDQLILRERGVT